jgi:imidazole glycerol-phosphate synthase subunit HisF
MKRIRIIPVLLLHKGNLVKSVKFKDYKYVGDPINAVRIFNDKEVNELVLIDIDASREKRAPDIKHITNIASEAFMPVAYGGGISNSTQVKEIFYNGVEKVIFNTAALEQPALITATANQFGSSSTVVSMDVKKTLLGSYKVYGSNGQKNTGKDPVSFAKEMESAGAGEIFINSIDADGTMSGYDTNLIKKIAESVSVPVIACGGAGSMQHFKDAVQAGASAVAAGSFFVFQGRHRAVLITYPNPAELQKM